jgi:hypothetical protein
MRIKFYLKVRISSEYRLTHVYNKYILSYLHNLDKFDTKTKVFSKDQIDVKISKPGITSLLSQKRLDGGNHKLSAPKIIHFGLSDTEKKVYGNR